MLSAYALAQDRGNILFVITSLIITETTWKISLWTKWGGEKGEEHCTNLLTTFQKIMYKCSPFLKFVMFYFTWIRNNNYIFLHKKSTFNKLNKN